MAAILSTVEGSFGSAVLSAKNGREGTMRERVTPANPKTAPQQNVRVAFGGSSKGFRYLPGVDAEAWGRYGKGIKGKNGKPLSGIGAYNQLAIVYRLVNPGATPPVAPPATPWVAPNIRVTTMVTPNGILFVGSASTDASTVLEVILAPLPQGNSKPRLSDYRTVAYTALTSAGGNEYLAEVPPGRYASGYRWVNRNTGEGTEMVQLNVLGVALQVVAGGEASAGAKAPRRRKAA